MKKESVFDNGKWYVLEVLHLRTGIYEVSSPYDGMTMSFISRAVKKRSGSDVKWNIRLADEMDDIRSIGK